MKFNWPTITWKKNLEIDELLDMLTSAHNINYGLNLAVGDLVGDMDSLKKEALNLISGIVLMHGGELVINKDFINSALESTDLYLKITKLDSGDISLSLINTEEIKEDAKTIQKD